MQLKAAGLFKYLWPFNGHQADSSVNIRDGCRPLQASMMKRFLSLVAGFVFTSREYISQHPPVAASET